MKKENIGTIYKPILGDFIVGCLICGEQKPVMLYPHRKNDLIVGWVFVCAEHEKDAQGLNVEFSKIEPPRGVTQLSKATPDG